MIHKNRGNRRWMDKRKRRSKYNLCQRIWGDATTFLDGILGKYDKGKIHDEENYKKTNSRIASKDHMGSHKMGNNYSHSDKKKVECCNDKIKDYEDGCVTNVYPSRCKFRGFDNEVVSSSYIKLSEWMKDNADVLYRESLD